MVHSLDFMCGGMLPLTPLKHNIFQKLAAKNGELKNDPR